jgi:hypothetical protein
MKSLFVAGLATVLLLTGCSSPKSVSNLAGKGTKQTFDQPFDVVWRAAVDGTQQGDLEILNADRSQGYISARRGVRAHTFGENVGVWVKSLGPSRSEVEVVSRQAGPPVAWLKNWEHEILRAIAANVTREAVGGTGTASTVIVPDTSERTTVVVPPSRTEVTVPPTRTETELRLQTLREEQRLREEALRTEQSEQRRQQIRAEIDRLREELRLQQQRLSDLEKEVK